MQKEIVEKRKDNEPPFAISKKGMRFHHLGIPTNKSFHKQKI